MSAFTDWLAARAAAREQRRPHPPAGRQRPRRTRCLDLAGNDYLGLSRHPAVVAARRRGRPPARSRRRRLPAGDRHADPPRGPRGSPGGLHRLPGRARVLHRLPRQPRRGLRAGRRRHPGRLRRARARLDDRRMPALPRIGARSCRTTTSARSSASSPAARSRGRSSSSRRSTPCWATRRRSRSWPRCVARHDAVLVADEAHALGVSGVARPGPAARRRASAAPTTWWRTLTLSKSLGSQGGAVLATPAVREHLVNMARPFIYDTGLAPAAAGAALAALGLVVERARAGRPRPRGSPAASPRPAACRSPPARCSPIAMPGPREAVAAVAACRRAGRPDRLLPPALHARRHLPAPAHRARAPLRRRGRPCDRACSRGCSGEPERPLRHRHRHRGGQDRGHGRARRRPARTGSHAVRREAGADRGRPRRAGRPRRGTPARRSTSPATKVCGCGTRSLPTRPPGSRGPRCPRLVDQRDRIAAALDRPGTTDVLVEGAGGCWCASVRHWTLLDLACVARSPPTGTSRSVVVARAGLGTLNHTALTVAGDPRARAHGPRPGRGCLARHPGCGRPAEPGGPARLHGGAAGRPGPRGRRRPRRRCLRRGRARLAPRALTSAPGAGRADTVSPWTTSSTSPAW